MTFDEIKSELDTFKDTPEYTDYISGLNPLSADRVTEYLNTQEGKQLIQPVLDKNFSKGLESWKSNNLNSLVDSKVKELYPDQTPEQKELTEIKAQFKQLQQEAFIKDLTNKALTASAEKGVPQELAKFLIGADETTTLENIDSAKAIFDAVVEKAVTEKLKGVSHVPPDDGTKPGALSVEDLNKMTTTEINKYFASMKAKK